MLDQILSLPNGARFFRVDLHNHTPADPGFHCGLFNLNTEAERQAFAREYVRFAKVEQGLDIIGVTDHNTVDWLDEIQAAAAEIGLIVFPGVELGANEGKRQVHYLALFEPGTPAAHIDHFVSSLGLLPNGRFHAGPKPTPRLTQLNTRQLTEKIASPDDGLPGIPIAAHATRKNGLLHELEGEGRVLAYEDGHLIALEIPASRNDLSDFTRRLVNGEAQHYGHKSVACLNSSDGRGIGQTNEKDRLSIGEKATYIKLSHISIEALRHALIDHDSRVRLANEFQEAQVPRLVGLRIDGGFLAANPESVEENAPFLLHLNPNLNTLIGGRGTGKSSLLEAIRYVFELEPRTDATRQQAERVIDVTLPSGGVIHAYYALPDGGLYQISRRKGQRAQVLDCASGERLALTPGQLFPGGVPLEVYGQKEVYEIANDVQFQLNLIDTYISGQLREVQREEGELLRALESNGRSQLRLREELADGEQQLAEAAALQLELERLGGQLDMARIQEKERLEEERRTLAELESRVAEHSEAVASLLARFAAQKLPLFPDQLPEQRGLVQQIEAAARTQLTELQAQLEALWAQGADGRRAWHATYAERDEAYQQMLQSAGGAAQIERYFALQEKVSHLQQLRGTLSHKRSELDELQATRHTLLNQLDSLRREQIFSLRAAKAEDLNAALQGSLRVEVTPFGNRAAYADFLSGLFNRRGITRRVIESLALNAATSPLDLANAIRTEQGAAPDDVTPLDSQFGVTQAYRKRLAALEDEILFELECYRIPDLPDIALRVGEEYRSLTPPPGVPGLSVGQKCTAILSLILVERNTPLVIDQPEDDLDNAFIFAEIVQTLRREKARRQFVIATHNANIPVSGDAELILLMKANEERGWIAHAGSIDDPRIRGPVENILEGGREAFRLRQAKYQIR